MLHAGRSKPKSRDFTGYYIQHVKPYSIVWSDQWASYNKISELHNSTLTHATVNHSYNFVDPDTLTCTNAIEGLWSCVKSKFKEMHGCLRVYIQGILEFKLF